MYQLPSASHTMAPFPRTMIGGSPPTARYARTGLLTPPGNSRAARSRQAAVGITSAASIASLEPPHVIACLGGNDLLCLVDVGARQGLRARVQVVDAKKATVQARPHSSGDGGRS